MKDSLSHNHSIQLRTMQLFVGCHSLLLFSFLHLAFSILNSHGLPISLPPDTTHSASGRQISLTESSISSATLQTTPMVTLNGVEIPMKVVPLEDMESRYFSYLTEGPPTTLKVEATSSTPHTDTLLVTEETTGSATSNPSEGIESTSASPPFMTKISTTTSIETTKPQELTNELTHLEETVISKSSLPDEELKSICTTTASPPLVTETSINSISETFKSHYLITTAVTNPIINTLDTEKKELLTTAQPDPQRVTTVISSSTGPENQGTEQNRELKEMTVLITTPLSTQESLIITSEEDRTTTDSLSMETPSVTIPISNSVPVEEVASLLSTFAPVTDKVSSSVHFDLPTTETLLAKPSSVTTTQVTTEIAITTIEATASASAVQEHITTAKAEESALQEVTTIPVPTAALAEAEKNQEGTPISSHFPEISTTEPIMSTTAELAITTVEAHLATTAQPLASSEPLAHTTQNIQLRSVATTASDIFDLTSSAAGVISLQTTESAPLISASSEANDKTFSTTSSSSALSMEIPDQIATEIKQTELEKTIGDAIMASEPKEVATSISTTSDLPMIQTTHSTGTKNAFLTISTASTGLIQDDIAAVVTTEPRKAKVTSSEIVKPADIPTTMIFLAESTEAITTSTDGGTSTSTEKEIVSEVITEAESKLSRPMTIAIETTALVIPEVIVTSTAVVGESTTEAPLSTLSSVTLTLTVIQDSAPTAPSMSEMPYTPPSSVVTEQTILPSLPLLTTFSSLLPDNPETEVASIPPPSVSSEIVSIVQSRATTSLPRDLIPGIPTSSDGLVVSDATQFHAQSPITTDRIADIVTPEIASITSVTETSTSTTTVSPVDAGLSAFIEHTGTQTLSTTSAEKFEIASFEIVETTQRISLTPEPTKEEQLQTKPATPPASAKNVEITTQLDQESSTPLHEETEIPKAETTTVAADTTTAPKPLKKEEIETPPPTEITIMELIQTTQALKPVVIEKPDPIKPAVDPNPQRTKDPDSEGMTLATAISMGLILIFLLILLCILAVSLIAGWIHCSGRNSRQPKVSLIRVERGLATEFADSWSKGMSAQAWMTTQSGTSTMNPIPSTSSPQLKIQPSVPPQSQNLHCGCKRRGLFGRANRLCMVHGDTSARHPTSAVRAVRIISLSDDSDEEEADAVLLAELGRRRASGASNTPGGEEEGSGDVGKGRGEWLFIDEA